MVLALPASRSCRKPGDCGSGHLSYGQDSLTLSLGKTTILHNLILVCFLKSSNVLGRQFDPIPGTLLPHICALQATILGSTSAGRFECIYLSGCCEGLPHPRVAPAVLCLCTSCPAALSSTQPRKLRRGASCISLVCFPNPTQGQRLITI